MDNLDHSSTIIDVYILSGQSNASGSSSFESAPEKERDHSVYENVLFFGYRRRTDGEVVMDHTGYEPVREGLGKDRTHIGPELGMAEFLNTRYDGEKHIALIVKFAAGGTSLLMHEDLDGAKHYFIEGANKKEERYRLRGSWFPTVLCPSELQRSFGEDPDHPTSFLYRQLKEVLKRVFRELREKGFRSENIRFAAFNWMQGEDDRRFPDAYCETFPWFVKDFREFLSMLTGQDHGSLPIIVGEVSETFASASPEEVERSRAFNRSLHTLEGKIENLVVIPTEHYELNELRNGENVPVGTDLYHWSYPDMRYIGRLFGLASYTMGQAELKRKEKENPLPDDSKIENPVLLSPMAEAPNYAFDHEPTPLEMRLAAVRAMHDMLSVQWYTPVSFSYRKSGAAAGKTYVFPKGEKNAGLPYTDVNVSLFGMLEYLDPDGRLRVEDIEDPEYPTLGQAVNRKIGNTCSGSTGFAICSVCSSIKSNLVSYTLTAKNGFYPVGGLEYDFSINEFSEPDAKETVTTVKICQKYGEAKVFEAYTKALPGDIMDMQGDDRSKGHSMMVLCAPTVTYRPDGTIDAEKSFIRTQDQRTGGYHFPTGPRGEDYVYSGRIHHDNTFRFLFDQGYIPVATAELLGKKPYERGEVRLSDERVVEDFSDLKTRTVVSNYPMTVLKLVRVKADGSEEKIGIHAFNRSEVGRGIAFSCPVEYMTDEWKEEKREGIPGEAYRLKVTLTTGEVFTVAEFTEPDRRK